MYSEFTEEGFIEKGSCWLSVKDMYDETEDPAWSATGPYGYDKAPVPASY